MDYASLHHWWSSSTLSGVTAQNDLVRRGFEGTNIHFDESSSEAISTPQSLTTDPSAGHGSSGSEGKIARIRKIQLEGGKDHYLNVLEVGTPVRKAGEHTFVVLHGYGGAFGFYWQNLAAMCSFPNTRIYLMDMLGMGLSGRPKFPSIKVKGDASSTANGQARASQAEQFFLDSFEDFAQKEKLNKFTIIGHSLGGYLSTSYALAKPERINKLILFSPVGIPTSPYHSDEEAELGEAQKAQKNEGVAREFSESQKSTTDNATVPSASASTRAKAPNSWWTKLWEANISPFSIVRFSSFLGPKLVSRYAARRFALFEAPVQADLFAYLYSVYGQRGSGEYCLAHILMPGAYARWPLINRIGALDGRIPVSFVYGDSDWMDKKAGQRALDLIKNKPDASELQRKQSKMYINDHAGHWVFLDNPVGMDKILKQEMQNAIRDHPQA
ncbi:hypothetical protein EMMF5_006133 [Cystobasidiomycetes sp. EMM_F5]